MNNNDLSRRTVLGVLGGGAVVGVAGCGSGSGNGESESESESGSGPASGSELVATGDVPVGSGVILKDLNVVVTQPTEGTFLAFSATCTHKGCAVGTITGDQILCPCHGSVFSTEDGSVLDGPAQRPLDAVEVEVQGRRVVKA